MMKMKELNKAGIVLMSAIMLMSIAPTSNLLSKNSAKASANSNVSTVSPYKQLKAQRFYYHHLVKREQRHLRRLQIRIDYADGKNIANPYGNKGLKRQIRHNLRASKKWAHQLASSKHNSDSHLRKRVRKMLYKGKSERKLIKQALLISQTTFNSKAKHHVRRIAHRLDFDATSASYLRYEVHHDGVKSTKKSTRKTHITKPEVKKYTRKYNKVKKALVANTKQYYHAKNALKRYDAIHKMKK